MLFRSLRQRLHEDNQEIANQAARISQELSDWTIHVGENSDEPIYMLSKTFLIPSSDFGTAFRLAISSAEQYLNHHCHEIEQLPDDLLRITLGTHSEKNLTDQDAKLGALIDRAYDPTGKLKAEKDETQAQSNKAICLSEPTPDPVKLRS